MKQFNECDSILPFYLNFTRTSTKVKPTSFAVSELSEENRNFRPDIQAVTPLIKKK